MPFDAFEVALELVRALNPVIEMIAQKDAALADQLRRSRTSIPLNLKEGRRQTGGNRLRYWNYAAGSADEVLGTLLVAEAAEYVERAVIEKPLALCDRLLAMTWRMTH
jgi:four helix bundle protein